MRITTGISEIRAALGRILGSPHFSGSERRTQLLRFIVEQAIQGESSSAKEAIIALQVFGRESYDPKIDALVRVEVARLRSALAKYYATDGVDDPLEISIPKGSYAPVFQDRHKTPAPDRARETPPEAMTPAPETPSAAARIGHGPLVWAGVLALLLMGVAAIIVIGGHRRNWTVQAHSHPENPVAKDFYLTGRYYWTERTPESLAKAVDYFTQAIVRDPNFALAYVGLADSYNLLREFGAMPPNEAFPRAIEAARRAVALDDGSAEAHSSLAFDLFWGAWDVDGAEREFRTAEKLNANYAPAYHWHATFLMTIGRSEEAVREIERARELDPASKAILADRALILFYAGDRDQALTVLKQMEAAEPAFRSPHTYLSYIYFSAGANREFISEERRIAALSKNPRVLALANAAENGLNAGGRKGMIESMLQLQKKQYAEGAIQIFQLAGLSTILGDRQQALDDLWASYNKRESLVITARLDPSLAGLHGEKSFQQLLARLGLPPVR